MYTIVILNNFEKFPTYYVLDGDYTRLNGVLVGATDQDEDLEDIVCNIDALAEVFSRDFPLEFLKGQILRGNKVAVVVCGIIP